MVAKIKVSKTGFLNHLLVKGYQVRIHIADSFHMNTLGFTIKFIITRFEVVRGCFSYTEVVQPDVVVRPKSHSRAALMVDRSES